ncbi:uncharacterized protein LOC142318923 isoform X2 [Lycorma delicatula]|uniref:uncharacterized protein LOC142318923 isoform X2 n=1 Tax=Lycorma delicatula TaxID=130591 RepID=UPI003F510F64
MSGSKLCRLCGVEKTVGLHLFGPEAIRTGLLSKIISQFPKEVEKTIECHTSSAKTAIVSVGADSKIRCEICLQHLEIVQWMTHWHVVTHGLGSVYCSCRECGHQDEVNSFIKENSVICPCCFFATCAKTLTSAAVSSQDAKKVYNCELCGKSFRSLGHKNRHKMIHDGLKPFLCETCGVGFNQKVSLKTHLLTHTSSYPHQCEWCGQAFRHKVSLRSHVINVHSPVSKSLNYECDQCKKQFATSHKLSRHYRSHTGEQPYRCTICDKSFSQTGNLKTHLKKHKTSTEFSDIDTPNHLLDSPTQKILGTMFDHDTSVHHSENKDFIPLRSQVQGHMHFTQNEIPLRKESVQDVFSNFDPHDCDIYNSIT